MINQNLLLTGDDAYNLTKSLRFRSSASAYMNRTPSNTNPTIWTASIWCKRGKLTSLQGIFSGLSNSNPANFTRVDFDSADRLRFTNYIGDVVSSELYSTAVYRDPSAWYHIVVAYDSAQSTNTNRVKMYVNGSQITAISGSYPAQNATSFIFAGYQMALGQTLYSGSTNYLDGYLSEVNFIDGQALPQSSFGETDVLTGVWKPKKYAGTYGTNGFYLPFSDNSSTTTLGYDKSGNSNNWTCNNISLTAGSTYDSMVDVPTMSALASNYCVINPINKSGGTTVSDGNLTVAGFNTSTQSNAVGTIAVTTGKWYFETTVSSAFVLIGISKVTNLITSAISNGVGANNAYSYYGYNGQKFNGSTGTSYGATYGSGDVIGVAFDLDTGSITFYKNGTSQGVAYTWSPDGSAFYPVITNDQSTAAVTANANFGQRPFAYTPPTGFVALNTFNLPEPSIKKGNKHFDATLWTGNGSSQTITNAGGIKPDLVWLKERSSTSFNWLTNSVTGNTKILSSNSTDAEATETQGITSFNSNGFSVGSNGGFNENTQTYVGWQWQAGQGTTSSNTAGTITSTVSANPTAGFSVVTYTGNGTSGATVGHGLGVAPKMVIVKFRKDVATDGPWYVYHSSLGATKNLILNTTAAEATASTPWNNTAPSSSVFSLGNAGDTNGSGRSFVAYCFAEVAGYSKAFSYTGNGSSDGVFVHLGFRPKYVMIKNTTTSGTSWIVLDSSRNAYNVTNNLLLPDSSGAEVTPTSPMDFLSNGIKLRDTDGSRNASSAVYVGIAFAENPFKYSLAR